MKKTKILTLIFSVIFISNSIIASNHPECVNTSNNELESGEFTLEINGTTIWFKISGSGPVCLLPTPGWGPGSELYFNSLNELESLFTMVYIDTRGTGRSGKPALEEITTTNLILDIDGVREHIGADEVWLMGHSKGGAIALEYAYTHPDNTLGIVLLDASIGVNAPQEVMQKAMMEKQNEPWFQVASPYFSREPKDEEDWVTGIRAIMPIYFSTTEKFEENKEKLTSVNLSYHAFQGQKYWYDCENEMPPKLKDIKIPTLIVVGMDDFICGPYVAQYAHREIPNSKLLMIEDAGHFPWMEQPDQFFEGIKSFLPKLGY